MRAEGSWVTSPFLISSKISENTDAHDGSVHSSREAANGSDVPQRRNGSVVCLDNGIRNGPKGGRRADV